MNKKARNLLIAVVVIAVVVCAALFIVVKGKSKPSTPVDETAPSSTMAPVTEPVIPTEEETTADAVADILATLNGQTTQAQQNGNNQQSQSNPQNTQGQPNSSYTTQKPVGTSVGSGNTASTTKKPIGTTKAPSTKATTAKAPSTKATTAKATTTKASGGSSASSGDTGPATAVSGQQALATGGLVSYLWNPDGNFYYVEDNPWQRQFGFNVLYDWAAATMVMYYDTWRAFFDYDGLEWMIQAWKGQYGFLFIGGEIGVYNRLPGAAVATNTHYNCADDNHLINMEMSIWYDAHDGQGYKRLFTRAYYPHWWITGFVDGHLADYKFNDRSCLVQTARLTMYDQDMLNAFTAALEKCGFRREAAGVEPSPWNTDMFTVTGLDVNYSWKTIDQGYKTR